MLTWRTPVLSQHDVENHKSAHTCIHRVSLARRTVAMEESTGNGSCKGREIVLARRAAQPATRSAAMLLHGRRRRLWDGIQFSNFTSQKLETTSSIITSIRGCMLLTRARDALARTDTPASVSQSPRLWIVSLCPKHIEVRHCGSVDLCASVCFGCLRLSTL